MKMLHLTAWLLALLLLRVAGAATGDAAVARGEIEKTLASMSAAILAADVGAYLSHVDDSDPIFLKEQQNWAADLERTPISSITLSIAEEGENRPVRFAADRSTFELVMAWELPPPKDRPEGKPLKREVSFPAAFVRNAATGAWRFAGEHWLVLEHDGPAEPSVDERRIDGGPNDPASPTPSSPHAHRHRARVKHLPGYEQVAARIADALPEIREHVDAEFGVSITRVQEVKVYPTMRHLQASIYLSYVQGLSGWNEPGESIKLLVRPNATELTLKPLLAHEYGHVATFELGPRATDMPWWALEGVAEMSAERFAKDGRASAERAVIRWHERGELADWTAIADFRSTPPALGSHVYKQGQHMLQFLTARVGRAGRIAWLKALAQGQTLDAATRQELGMSFAELDAAWRAHVRQRADLASPQREPPADAEPPTR